MNIGDRVTPIFGSKKDCPGIIIKNIKYVFADGGIELSTLYHTVRFKDGTEKPFLPIELRSDPVFVEESL